MKNIIMFILLIAVVICAITFNGTYEADKQPIESNTKQIESVNKYDIMLELADFTIEQHKKGNLEVGKYIDEHNLLEYTSEDSDIYDYFKKDFYQLLLVDENTVIIINTVLFHSVTGYLVNDGTEIPQGKYDVLCWGFDGDCVNIDSKIDGYDNLYHWHAGY